MMYKLKTIVILGIAAALAGQPVMAEENGYKKPGGIVKKNKYDNRRILVRYKEDTTENRREHSHFSVGAYVLQSYDIPKNLDVVEVAKGISIDAALEFYREDPNVLYAEPDYPIHALLEPPPTNPTPPDDNDDPPSDTIDPRYPEQWALNNEGQTGGTADADINAPEMWATITGDRNVIVAVIDTGINYNHPDLRNNIWTNPGEIPDNGIDDDGNGVIDDVHGFNALDNSGDPMDDHGHGSHCAGVIGAEGQNRYGGRGVMQEVSIIGCKFLSASGGGTASGAIACLDYLRNLKSRAENPVDIILTSNSWGGGPSADALKDAIQAHQDLGILFVAAASNDGQDNDVVDAYPADYPLANIIAVAATDSDDNKAWFSNFGKRTVHVGAPGVGILSTVLGNDYEEMDGTSMATPFVAGLAGMIKASNPDLNYMQIKNLIMAGGDPIPALEGKTISGRRIRAFDTNGRGSLTCVDQIVSGRLSPSLDHLLMPVGQIVLLSAVNINCALPNGDIVVPFKPGIESLTLLDDGLGLDSSADDGLYSQEWLAEAPGKYEFVFPENDVVTITVYDPATLQAYTQEVEANFAYRQIAGTALDAIDDGNYTVTAPFNISFGGSSQTFDVVTISSNGAVSVTNSETVDIQNQPLPQSKFVSLIAAFWDDLNPAASDGDIYYDTLGQEPNREFVVEWRNVPHYTSPDDGGTFQIVFFENSSDILFNYLDVDFGNPMVDNGASATVGVQTTDTKFVQVSYDSPTIQSNTGIRFKLAEADTPPAPAPEPSPDTEL